MNPSSFKPSTADFIGGAATVARIFAKKAPRLLESGDATKILLFGAPGIGKTALADTLAAMLAGHSSQIESLNGRNVTADKVRRWSDSANYLPLYGKFTVRIVNELDTCPLVAQDLLLTYLDELPRFTAFIGTSNLQLSQLSERFQTRMQQFKITPPVTSEVIALLSRWSLPAQIINQIAVGCGGNVRAALLDAQNILDAV
jgi:replication-associated recombination protein RarA